MTRSPYRAGSAGIAQQKVPRRPGRWMACGATLGALLATLCFAPARWLTGAVNAASQSRVILAEAEGTVWDGSALAILTGGAGSRDARALPSRLQWSLRSAGWLAGQPHLRLHLRQACCLPLGVTLALHVGLGTWRIDVLGAPASADASAASTTKGAASLGLWPANLLAGLGTPWNTVQPGGSLRLSSQDLVLRWAEGRFSLQGQALVDLRDFSSRLSTLPRLGNYRLAITAAPAQAGTAQVSLTTQDGALRMQGDGEWGPGGLRLRGEASAATPDDEPALNNLLNIIGRRQGASSIINIGSS